MPKLLQAGLLGHKSGRGFYTYAGKEPSVDSEIDRFHRDTATAGLGQMVLNASNFLRTDVVIMGIVVIGVVAYLFDLMMRRIERALVPWKGQM